MASYDLGDVVALAVEMRDSAGALADATAVALTVRDNGLGAPGHAATGFGLLGLGERARQLGGRLDAASEPGAGYRLTLTLPTDTLAPRAQEQPAAAPQP